MFCFVVVDCWFRSFVYFLVVEESVGEIVYEVYIGIEFMFLFIIGVKGCLIYGWLWEYLIFGF